MWQDMKKDWMLNQSEWHILAGIAYCCLRTDNCRLDKWSQRLSEAARLSPQDSFTFNIKTVATLILTCLCALLANAAGIGGGPIYLPLLMVSQWHQLSNGIREAI